MEKRRDWWGTAYSPHARLKIVKKKIYAVRTEGGDALFKDGRRMGGPAMLPEVTLTW
jgi:hypothetical protein